MKPFHPTTLSFCSLLSRRTLLHALMLGVLSAVTLTATAGDRFGTLIGSYQGVPAYSNESGKYESGKYNSVTHPQTKKAVNTGMMWQCVEYTNRYYTLIRGLDIRVAGTNAADYYGTASKRGLTAYPNGGRTPPETGDILCFTGGGGGFGHVSLVRERTASQVVVIQQNVRNTSGDERFQHKLTVQNGVYMVSAAELGSAYKCVGWLRAPSKGRKAIMVSPGNGSVLTSPLATFAWAGGEGVSEYSLMLGTTGPGEGDFKISLGTGTQVLIKGLPVGGETLYVRLGSKLKNGWEYSDSSYRCPQWTARLTSPEEGARLATSTTFRWQLNRAQEVVFELGRSRGDRSLLSRSLGTQSMISLSGLPRGGTPLWVRLWTRLADGWRYADHSFTAR
jgi:hypothetical protein